MSQFGILTRAVEILDRLGIPYMLTGSLASSLQGNPRATHDVDLVVDLPAERIDAILAEFAPPAYYCRGEAIAEAIRDRSMFNVLGIDEGDKIDFWMLTDEPFDQSRFARRRPVELDGTQVAVSTPEDTILMKLKWSRDAGGSRRQFLDALRVYELQHALLDRQYLDLWLDRLGLRPDWERLLSEAAPS